MLTPLTHAIICLDDEGPHQLMAIGQQKVKEAKMGLPSGYATLSEMYQVSKSTLHRMYSGESNLRGVQYKKHKADVTIAKAVQRAQV